MAFNENTRVKIPALIHLTRLGYEYLSLKDNEWDESTNIFTDIFLESITKINPDKPDLDVSVELIKLIQKLDNDDLGQEFYKSLISTSGTKFIDFNNPENNTFHICTELTYKKGEEEFRPDITVLINGLPLVFIEVKKPNNSEGIIAERNRINLRFQNKNFKKFVNITQLLIFSNNMEYDDDATDLLQGAFYSTTSYKEANFNYFREEENFDDFVKLTDISELNENRILSDNNLNIIKHAPEYITNKEANSPTNRIISSLLSRDRLLMLLKYGIAYNNTSEGIEKHIMRYPQLFATKAIEKKLNDNEKHGIIWHTQGSGKTALAYYNVNYLTEYYKKKNIVPRFYFIVDRIDLLNQAKREFSSRGLVVNTVNSKAELLNDFKIGRALVNLSGEREITVVNIHKFKEDSNVVTEKDYATEIQRVYFLDEVHRSYNPKGSFLANLFDSDRDAVMIGLTGTPLIGGDNNSKQVFGNYIHKYYYNRSIADGYTLKLIREGIETKYRLELEKTLQEIEVLKGQIERREVYSHRKFVDPMLNYIIDDFVNSRNRLSDQSIGGMVVCDSSDQAKMMFEIFQEKKNDPNFNLKSALILHDIDDKEIRKQNTIDFKEGKIDLLFVYNMLLTGFDAKRLKKLYLGRVIKKHNLLQTLTRVNRPYKNFKYSYVVDFADIRKEFDKTNKEYFDELQLELGDEFDKYTNLFKTQEEIDEEIKEIKNQLFSFDTTNSEKFSQQISEIKDKNILNTLRASLENARNLYNVIRLQGNFDLLNSLDFKKLNELYNEVVRRIQLINYAENLESSADNSLLLNNALEDVIFAFIKVSEDEMVIADQLKGILKKTRGEMEINIDKEDKEYILLYDELKRLFKNKKLDEITQEDMKTNIGQLEKIYEKIKELNNTNARLKDKFDGDQKFVRVHKRIVQNGSISQTESDILDVLKDIKVQTDQKVLINNNIINNQGFFNGMMGQVVVNSFQNKGFPLDNNSAVYITNVVSKQYLNEFME